MTSPDPHPFAQPAAQALAAADASVRGPWLRARRRRHATGLAVTALCVAADRHAENRASDLLERLAVEDRLHEREMAAASRQLREVAAERDKLAGETSEMLASIADLIDARDHATGQVADMTAERDRLREQVAALQAQRALAACPVEAVLGPESSVPCLLLRGHDGKHEYVAKPAPATDPAPGPRSGPPPWAGAGSIEDHAIPRREAVIPPMEPEDVVEPPAPAAASAPRAEPSPDGS